MKRAVVGGLVSAMALGALEVGLRVTDVGSVRGEGDWSQSSPTVGWEPRPGYGGDVYGGRRGFGSSGLLLCDERQLSEGDGATIVLYGDSNTFGVKVPTEDTFAERLDDALPDARVINLAVPGYTSFQGLVRLRETVDDLAPDLVVLSFNYNDRRYCLREEDVDGAEHFARSHAPRVRSRLLHLQIGQLLAAVLHKPEGKGRHTRAADPELRSRYAEGISVADLHARVGPEAYRQNLVAAVELLASRGVPVALLLLGDNPRQVSRVTGAGVEADELQRLEHLADVIAADSAMAVLARKQLAEALGSQGEAQRAADLLVLSRPLHSSHGGHVLFPDTVYHDVMRDVAIREGVWLVDAYSAMRERPELFTDYCHFNAEGHAVVFTSLLQFIKDSLEFGAAPNSSG